ncbi:hypothetical protein ZWY2020_026188 [Hordeum vulgare]|nr:hypothetical protein ZWY2020_026188 [Hordeum vulgare]
MQNAKMQTTQTVAGDDGSIQLRGTSAAPTRRWSKLPDDLLRLVITKLAGPIGSARFAAVCTSWRAVVSTLPPRLPWLILDTSSDDKAKHVYCLGDAVILPPIPFPSEAVGKRFVGSYDGGWIVPSDAPLRIMNLFSRAEVPLSAQQRKVRIVNRPTGSEVLPSKVRPKNPPARLGSDDQLFPLKMIFSEPPTSSSCILAAISDEHDVAICGLGHLERGWTRQRFVEDTVLDITFCNGHLYCLMGLSNQLVRCDISLTEYGTAAFGVVHWLPMPNRLFVVTEGKTEAYTKYILELRGNLVIVARKAKDPFFLVFELVHVDTDRGKRQKWKQVTNLGDHALFLEPMCAKSMHISASEHEGPQRNHIYYSHSQKNVPKPKDTSRGCRVYCKKDENVDNGVNGITSVAYHVSGGAHPAMWLLPPTEPCSCARRARR